MARTKAPPTLEPETLPPDFKTPAELALQRLELFNKTSKNPTAEVSDEVADAVYQLRVSGQSEESISKVANLPLETITHVVAQRAELRRAREAMTLGIDAMLELDRLDQMQEAIWPQVMSGNLSAVDRAIKIGQDRRTLKGLDAPTIRATLNVSATAEDIDYSQYSAEELKMLTALLAKGKKRT